MTGSMPPQNVRSWIGRERSCEDIITARLVEGYRATLDPWLAQVPDGEAPLGIHWCLAPPSAVMADLGEDGHERRGDFLPPIGSARRMWAGGTIEFVIPLEIGATIRRRSRIEDIVFKQGRTGPLWFVAVDHEYVSDGHVAIRERHDIVYREMNSATTPPPRHLAHDAAAGEVICASSTLLFRYSALTFNGHRIHYDVDYARKIEGYDGLVVHGPLQATLLMNLAARTRRVMPRHFAYRGVQAAIAGSTLQICGEDRDAESYACWTTNSAGEMSMTATAAFRTAPR